MKGKGQKMVAAWFREKRPCGKDGKQRLKCCASLLECISGTEQVRCFRDKNQRGQTEMVGTCPEGTGEYISVGGS